MFQDEKRLKPCVFWTIFTVLLYMYLNAILVHAWDSATVISSLTVYFAYLHFEASKQ